MECPLEHVDDLLVGEFLDVSTKSATRTLSNVPVPPGGHRHGQ
jgi:hypothetical protein